MWLFNKKKSAELDLSWLGADMHSHVLPAIDDGSPDISTSLELIKGLNNIGFKKIITTPHIFWDLYPNTPEIIKHGVSQVRSAVKEHHCNIEIEGAAEYYMDEHFENELVSKAPFLKISGSMVLVEFSMVTAKIDLQETLFEMQMQNYQPIIAHPERYAYLNNRRTVYDDLKSGGNLFQLNLLSLTGYYGNTIKELAEYLVKQGYYDFAGTDLHHERQLTALNKLSENKVLQQLKDSGCIRNGEL